MRTAKTIAFSLAALLLVAPLFSAGAPTAQPKLVREIDAPMPGEDAVRMPLALESAEAVHRVFAQPDARQRILEGVDFKTHRLLLFTWQGSGQDRLEYVEQWIFSPVDGAGAPEISFSRIRGLTRDLRQHCRLFVIPRSATWRTEGMEQ